MQRSDDFVVRLCGGCNQLVENCECRFTSVMPKKLPPLTAKQRAVLEMIAGWQKSGVSPSLIDISYEFGLGYRTSAKVRIDALVRKGYLAKPPKHGRAFVILAMPE